MKYTSITVYGIPNCDSVKKARTWLATQGHESVFHDFKKQGLPEKALNHWLKVLGWESVLNRKGSSWRKLTVQEQGSITSAASAKVFLMANPSLIKRPVIEWQSGTQIDFTVGYQPEAWLAR